MNETITVAAIGFFGAIVGGYFSYRGNKSASEDSIKAQQLIFEENKAFEQQRKDEEIRKSAKIIYLDFLNAVYEGFNVVKDSNRPNIGTAPNLLPIYSNYSSAIASLSELLNSDELILISKFYGIMDKIRHDILEINYTTSLYDNIKFDYDILLVEAFGENFTTMLKYDLQNITKDFIVDQLDINYRNTFDRLREISGLKKYGN